MQITLDRPIADIENQQQKILAKISKLMNYANNKKSPKRAVAHRTAKLLAEEWQQLQEARSILESVKSRFGWRNYSPNLAAGASAPAARV